MPEKKRILIVEDDLVSLGAFRQILGQSYSVTTASSGEEALALLQGETFDLFVLDVTLPGMSGYDLCRRIREHPSSENTPVIFLTAKDRLMDQAEGQDAGSDLYLTKPILAVKLLKMVGLFLTEDSPLSRSRRPPPVG